MEHFNLTILWEWDYDKHFNECLLKKAKELEISVLLVSPNNLAEIDKKISENTLKFDWYLDRASESDSRFLPLLKKLQEIKCHAINPLKYVHKSINKAYMHRMLSTFFVPLPETLIIPSVRKCPDLPYFSFENIGIPFVLKPANGGGGDGVHLGLTEINQINYYRNEFPLEEYLIQQTVVPEIKAGRPLWFRVFFVCGHAILSFWNPKTKIFAPIQSEDLEPGLVRKIQGIVKNIAKICKLNFFSSEVAVQVNGFPLVIDYVNDPIDLRIKSSHPDGIPDDIMDRIILSLLEFIAPVVRS